MVETLFGVFIVLHGLVHVLYLGQSRRFFELQPGMAWPDGSWAISRVLDEELVRTLAAVLCGLVALAFVIAGAGILVGSAWWKPTLVGAAILSSVIFLMFWNARMQQLDAQGAVALLLNGALLVLVLVVGWPST